MCPVSGSSIASDTADERRTGESLVAAVAETVQPLGHAARLTPSFVYPANGAESEVGRARLPAGPEIARAAAAAFGR